VYAEEILHVVILCGGYTMMGDVYGSEVEYLDIGDEIVVRCLTIGGCSHGA